MTTLWLLAIVHLSNAQESKTVNYGSLSAGIGNSQGSIALDYFHNWKLGEKQMLEIGFGGRFTSYFGSSQYYETAPAKLTTGSVGPGVLFKETIKANIDSVLVKSPQVNALNLAIDFGYRLSNKVRVGFNIDVVGFSFGQSKSGNYLNGSISSQVSAKPTSFNILGIGDNDHGSLNSLFYAQYFLSDVWIVKAGLQYLFTEYTTSTNVQQFPEANDRFRNKSFLLSIGVTRKFK
ncbi:MAG: hypothetical protein JSS93_10275 [Bacteroidetes bacterium]|nr:hypothetical protein [Bacteroidota bacterium]